MSLAAAAAPDDSDDGRISARTPNAKASRSNLSEFRNVYLPMGSRTLVPFATRESNPPTDTDVTESLVRVNMS